MPKPKQEVTRVTRVGSSVFFGAFPAIVVRDNEDGTCVLNVFTDQGVHVESGADLDTLTNTPPVPTYFPDPTDEEAEMAGEDPANNEPEPEPYPEPEMPKPVPSPSPRVPRPPGRIVR